jgi:predicted ester cyclase
MAQHPRRLTLRIIQEIWNAKNPSLIEELYSDDCVIHTPDGEVRGVEGSKRLYQDYTSSFPDLQFEIQQIVAEGDMASAQLVFTGTHMGPLGEIPASRSGP